MTQYQAIDLRKATGKAACELAREREAVRFRQNQPPRPGDTFVFRQTTNVPVEWAVIDRDPDDSLCLLVVPIDDYPQVGSHDLELEPGSPGDVGRVRCDLESWLDSSRFDPKLRTGTLEAESLERIRVKRAEILEGTLVATMPEEEVDGDPEYRRWKDETLQGALRSLRPAVRRSRGHVRPHLALAASVLLVVALAGLWEILDLRSELMRARDETGFLGRRLARLQERLDETRGQLAETRLTAVAHNMPVARLTYAEERRRRGPFPLPIPPKALSLVLVLEVVDPETYPRYGLRIIGMPGREEVWSTHELHLMGSVLSLSLPASMLDSGKYELILEGIGTSGPKRLDESYRLEIEKLP